MASIFCLVTRTAFFCRPRVSKKCYPLPKIRLIQRNTHEIVSMKCQSSAVAKSHDHETNSPSFASLFESSQFARIENPVGKKVEAEVIAVVGDKLYVDFGCKFHAVVERPKENKGEFFEGLKVVVLVKDLEMSMHPLGSSKDLSLLEAEVELCTDVTTI